MKNNGQDNRFFAKHPNLGGAILGASTGINIQVLFNILSSENIATPQNSVLAAAGATLLYSTYKIQSAALEPQAGEDMNILTGDITKPYLYIFSFMGGLVVGNKTPGFNPAVTSKWQDLFAENAKPAAAYVISTEKPKTSCYTHATSAKAPWAQTLPTLTTDT